MDQVVKKLSKDMYDNLLDSQHRKLNSDELDYAYTLLENKHSRRLVCEKNHCKTCSSTCIKSDLDKEYLYDMFSKITIINTNDDTREFIVNLFNVKPYEIDSLSNIVEDCVYDAYYICDGVTITNFIFNINNGRGYCKYLYFSLLESIIEFFDQITSLDYDVSFHDYKLFLHYSIARDFFFNKHFIINTGEKHPDDEEDEGLRDYHNFTYKTNMKSARK